VKGTRATGYWTPEEDAKLNSAVTNEAAKHTSNDTAINLPVAAAFDHSDADAGPVKGARVPYYWTPKEDAKLNSAATNTSKKKYGKVYKMEWSEISALVPDGTKMQYHNRWHQVLDPSIDRTNARTGKWAAIEDNKLKDAVQTHGGKNWVAISVLVPGRTKIQGHNRWH
jgi:hypothetical protein